MDLGNLIIAATMSGELTTEEGDRLLDVHYRVIREIICPLSGRVLDSRTAHLLTIRPPEGEPVKIVVDPRVSNDDVVRALVAGATLTDRWDPAETWTHLNQKRSREEVAE